MPVHGVRRQTSGHKHKAVESKDKSHSNAMGAVESSGEQTLARLESDVMRLNTAINHLSMEIEKKQKTLEILKNFHKTKTTKLTTSQKSLPANPNFNETKYTLGQKIAILLDKNKQPPPNTNDPIVKENLAYYNARKRDYETLKKAQSNYNAKNDEIEAINLEISGLEAKIQDLSAEIAIHHADKDRKNAKRQSLEKQINNLKTVPKALVKTAAKALGKPAAKSSMTRAKMKNDEEEELLNAGAAVTEIFEKQIQVAESILLEHTITAIARFEELSNQFTNSIDIVLSKEIKLRINEICRNFISHKNMESLRNEIDALFKTIILLKLLNKMWALSNPNSNAMPESFTLNEVQYAEAGTESIINSLGEVYKKPIDDIIMRIRTQSE
jgi:hypothetical protein